MNDSIIPRVRLLDDGAFELPWQVPAQPELLVHELVESFAPARAHPDDSGLDLRADVHSVQVPKGSELVFRTMPDEIMVAAGGVVAVPCGIRVAFPRGFDLQVRPRSGFATRSCTIIVNSPGTIDCGYRGPIIVVLRNLSADHTLAISHGDRIAQLIMTPMVYPTVRLAAAGEMDDGTPRGAGGFGSTGR